MIEELTNKVVPLDSLLKTIDEYVLEQKNHQLTRTPERMSTIECVADWCKKFAIGLSEPKSHESQEDMWNELYALIHGGTNPKWNEDILIKFKEQFTITRNKIPEKYKKPNEKWGNKEEIQQAIDNKIPVFIDRSYYFYDKPTIILEFCGNPDFVKVEGSIDSYETYRLRPAPMRITRSRKQKQVSPNGLPIVYVGRPTRWGNPFKVVGQEGHWFVINEDEHPLVSFEKKEDATACCVENYKEYITHEHNLGIKNIADLIDKNLSCWCPKDCLCHADILIELASKIRA